ncbi:UDP-N-acetylmuramoyl-L-alanine--D-glutamate ligase [Planomonospora parontospora]|uniref:UDP-N-acetylmuramoyl-L-alanine--D-glutamate ligase n=1 Tax=Planomonospora parontospora TaxID=58119 RepID=UPI00167171E6|nr:UDP-N-acetylmuramoyl-L-alanine--D-glutamate ligase [Planomonospora parontospora]GGL20407.1 UDP-N-acetylmuramoylalanine--D-glutamate ligase [Planomonospora parontospora subsp. antibiotica]GII13606.1 UDP-N-acetylmuramoylalanine--D-glutamate ligase [Planomonospora parontospora subsp. antibiotica]
MICVLGAGLSGAAAARLLAARGEKAVVLEGRDGERQRAVAAELAEAGVEVRFGEPAGLPEGTTQVVATGWPPHHPLLAAAARAGIEVIGEVELAWRLRPEGAAPWLALTGTNGKTTVVRMLTSMLLAAGHRALAVGNVGVPVAEAVAEPYDVLAVELSSFQLHRAPSIAPLAAAVLNVAPDHLDWHGSMEEYARAKGEIFARAGTVVYNADDEWSARLAAPYGGAVGFTLQVPRPGQVGVVEDLLVDRAFTADPVREAAELASLGDVRPFAPHNVANALAAAALARAYGVPEEAVRRGLRNFVPDPHRIAHVARVGGVDYVDDSKATNPHAAAASLAAYPSIVWVAGGQLKGADVDDLVRQAAPRLRGAVLLGADRERIRQALARHAANVPVVEVAEQDTGAMDRVVAEAARLAAPGDTVLLAPAGASLDMFTGYPARGEAFARAVHRLGAPGDGSGT